MIWIDATKTGPAGHPSGIGRVSTRLREELGAHATACTWSDIRRGRARPGPADWYLTAEVFAPVERPGFADFVARRPCRIAAIFHDAIPLKRPDTTWPNSVARHAAYLTHLAQLDHVFAVSAASREELAGFWRWQGRIAVAPLDVIELGADFRGGDRPVPTGGAQTAIVPPGSSGTVADTLAQGATPRPDSSEPGASIPARSVPVFVAVGILEPRKNQTLLLDVCESLWDEGADFELHLVGRVNPFFGKPIAQRVARLIRRYPGLHYWQSLSDAALAALYRRAHATIFPSLAEGCGLPVLESLWQGVPCVCSDLPAIREHAAAGGCVLTPPGDGPALNRALRSLLFEPGWRARLADEAVRRRMPTWADAARAVLARLAPPSPPDSV